MSLTYLLLLFLCISFHACNARRLSSLDHKKLDREKKTHFSIKNDNKNGLDPSSKQLGVLKNWGNMKQTGLVDDAEKPLMDKRSTKVKGKAASGSPTQTHESLVSVSWRVPHKKRGEKNPEFNLDYSPPKTHPPSHN